MGRDKMHSNLEIEDIFVGSTSSIGETYSELPDCLDDSMQIEDILKVSEKGGVQFRSRTSIEDIMGISRGSTYNIEEKVSYWGESDDHKMRKANLKKEVQDFYIDGRTSDSDFTTLGIDDKGGKGRTTKKANRMISLNAVMDEQDLQYREGILDDELLADVYSFTSTAAKKAAQIKATRLHNEMINGEK